MVTAIGPRASKQVDPPNTALTSTRRQMLRSVAVASAAFVLTQCAPTPPRTVHRIGWLSNSTAPSSGPLIAALLARLRELGYEEGRDIELVTRFADGRPERIESMVEELRSLQVRVVLSFGSALFAKPYLGATPLVMAGGAFDPVDLGIVDTLARPGGNITGVAILLPALISKRMELLREISPGISSVGFMRNISGPPAASALHLRYGQEAGQALGIRVVPMDVDSSRPDPVAELFPAAAASGVQGFVMAYAIGVIHSNKERVTELAATHALPAVYADSELVSAGGLCSLGPDGVEQARRAAGYVDKILRGAKPSELPIDVPEKVEIAVNLAAARRLGLTFSPSVLARANTVVK